MSYHQSPQDMVPTGLGLPPTGKSLEERLFEERRIRKYVEQTLDERQREVDQMELERNAAYQGRDRAVAELTSLEDQVADLRRRLGEAQERESIAAQRFNDAQNLVFQLQPRRTEITDAEAQEQFEALFGSVHRWVQNRLSPILDDLDDGKLRAKPVPQEVNRLLKLIPDEAMAWSSADMSDEYFIMAAVMRYLCCEVFDKPFYCPLDDSKSGDKTIKLVENVQSAMLNLPRDLTHCRNWRSETLTALASRQEFLSRRPGHTQKLVMDLSGILSVVLPRLQPREIEASVRSSIVEPAMRLAHGLQLATKVYTIEWPSENNHIGVDYSACKLMYLAGSETGGRETKRSKNLTFLFAVCPGLYVLSPDELGKKPTVVREPNILVFDGEHNIAKKPTLIRWLSAVSSVAQPGHSALQPGTEKGTQKDKHKGERQGPPATSKRGRLGAMFARSG